MSETNRGACFCTAVEIEVTGSPEGMGYCHCDSCRTWSAGPVNAFTLWKPDAVKVLKGSDKIKTFEKTKNSQRQFCGLEISILALSVLDARRAEARYPEVFTAMLECKSAEARDRLAELTIEALGYYALPDPDPLLIDNEGPIGHHRALAAMAALSGYFTRAGLPAGDVAYEQKNALARALFNFQ